MKKLWIGFEVVAVFAWWFIVVQWIVNPTDFTLHLTGRLVVFVAITSAALDATTDLHKHYTNTRARRNLDARLSRARQEGEDK